MTPYLKFCTLEEMMSRMATRLHLGPIPINLATAGTSSSSATTPAKRVTFAPGEAAGQPQALPSFTPSGMRFAPDSVIAQTLAQMPDAGLVPHPDPLPAPEAAPVPAPARTRRIKKPQLLSMPFSPTITAEGLLRRRHTFEVYAAELRMKGNAPIPNNTILDFSELVFGKIVSQQSIDRLINLYHIVSAKQEKGEPTDAMLVSRNEQLQKLPLFPESHKRLFNAYVTAFVHADKTNSALNILILNNHRYELYYCWSKLVMEVDDSWSDFVTTVKHANMLPHISPANKVQTKLSRGVSKQSVVRRYFSACLGIEQTVLESNLRMARAINMMVFFFGRGIIPFLHSCSHE